MTRILLTRVIGLCVSIGLLNLLAGCTEPQKVEQVPLTEFSANGQLKSTMADTKSLEEIMAEAQSVYEQAKAREHSWIVTAKHLAGARKHLAEGDRDAALVQARRALLTAKASLEQADIESKAWKARVPTGKN